MQSLGIIAGNGRFPILAAREARANGFRVAVAAIEDEADPTLEKFSDAWQWVKIGELKKLVKFFRGQGIHEAIMAGKVEKVRIFQGNVRPDLDMFKLVARMRDFKDDTLLGGIAHYLHQEGVDLLDSTRFLKNLIPGAGILGKKKPSEEILGDLHFGFQMAKAIAGLDVGQTVVVKKKAVLAVEAIEGTDRAIRRAAELGGTKITVVKVAKPNQDMRFDVPAVGLHTLKELIAAKAAAFGFEAGKTLFLDREELIEKANAKGIVLMGMETDPK